MCISSFNSLDKKTAGSGCHFLLTFRPQYSKLLAFFIDTPIFELKVPKVLQTS